MKTAPRADRLTKRCRVTQIVALTLAPLVTWGCSGSEDGPDGEPGASDPGPPPARPAATDPEFVRSLQDAVASATRGQLALSGELIRAAEGRAVGLGDVDAALEVAILPGLWSLWATGDASAAVQMVEEEVARQPVTGLAPPHPAHLVLAAFFADAGQAGRAQAFMSQYLRDAPTSRPGGSLELPASFHAARGAIAMAAGRHAEAVQALQTDPGAAPGAADQAGLLARHFRLGLALERLGARDSAIAVYQRVVEEAEGALVRADAWALPYALIALGELLEARGDPETAAVYFRQFVDLWRDADPELQTEVADVRARLSAGR